MMHLNIFSKLITRYAIMLATCLLPSTSTATLNASSEMIVGDGMPNDLSGICGQQALSWSAAIAPGHDGKADWIHLDQGEYGLGGPFDISTSDIEDMTKSSGSVYGGFSNPTSTALNPITFMPVTIKSSSDTNNIENTSSARNYSAYLLEMCPSYYYYYFSWSIPFAYTININSSNADSRIRITKGDDVLLNKIFSEPGTYTENLTLDININSSDLNPGAEYFISFYLYTRAGSVAEPPTWTLLAISLMSIFSYKAKKFIRGPRFGGALGDRP
ncbi:MAG: hypothetical protein JMN25_18440 [gamma proteobacterium endosymbiont of Lamellibrachia anaximandri]|nr:hypothetical protein [gamma proteobacterium endosymbiont of Lamellibrachia anaximandri]